ncbi:hypothetical protein SBF1_50012 [Candidatus Desulfosporosinus infrequens]|uniref:Phage head-tail adaptor n=1 Tax=Candidatus Desulfosporosinus infrequens TaxID=2043169 RepID=A0A2U3LGV9_9FIRM|nr:hypothetical protein SBF1_50012 [Candidatus Desulfosporosinus infrequens]
MRYDRIHSITLQNRASGQDLVGSEVNAFVDVITFGFVAYVPNTGRMYQGASSMHTETECEFQLYYSPIPQSNMYVLFNGVRYLIQTVLNVGGLNREMRILCKLET